MNVDGLKTQDTCTLIFDIWQERDFILKEIESGKPSAVKLIPRDQRLGDKRFAEALLHLKSVPAHVPVFYDSFRHGHDMRYQPCLDHVIAIATQTPERAVIVSHAGGHQLLDYFIHLRTLKNIYYDISLILQYFYHSSVFADIKNLIQQTSKKADLVWIRLSLDFATHPAPNIHGDCRRSVA